MLSALQKVDVAELLFTYEIYQRGFMVFESRGNGLPYDVIIDACGKLYKVQVKSTHYLHKDHRSNHSGYAINMMRSKHQTYVKGMFDLLAAYVQPEDAWYIIPAKEVLRKAHYIIIPKY